LSEQFDRYEPHQLIGDFDKILFENNEV